MNRWPFFLAALFYLGACTNSSSTSSSPEKKYVEIRGIDSSKRPGDNFFMYVNGIWYDSAQIPSTQAGVGAYMFMNYPQRLRLMGILDSVSKATNAPGSIEQKIGDFFASGMDTQPSTKEAMIPSSLCWRRSTPSLIFLH